MPTTLALHAARLALRLEAALAFDAGDGAGPQPLDAETAYASYEATVHENDARRTKLVSVAGVADGDTVTFAFTEEEADVARLEGRFVCLAATSAGGDVAADVAMRVQLKPSSATAGGTVEPRSVAWVLRADRPATVTASVGPRGEVNAETLDALGVLTGPEADLLYRRIGQLVAMADVEGLAAALLAKADLVGGKLVTSQLPPIATAEVVAVADEAAMLALTPAEVQPGDRALRQDLDQSPIFVLTDADPSALASWRRQVEVPGVYSINGQSGSEITLGPGDVGAAAASHVHAIGGVTGLQAALDALAPRVQTVTVTADRAVTAADNGTRLVCTSAVTLTVDALGAGTECEVVNASAGAVTLVAGTAALVSPDGLTLDEAGRSAHLLGVSASAVHARGALTS